MATLKLEIVTPEKVAYSDDVDMVVLPGTEGEMGVLPMHSSLLTQINPGEVIVSKSGVKQFLASNGVATMEHKASLKGIADEMTVYEIP